MDLVRKRRLDSLLGWPALFLLRPLTRGLGALLRRSHEREPVHTILVVKFQGMGSLMIAQPALRRLRRSRPGVRVIFWGTPGTTLLARQLDEFDLLLELDDRTPAAALRSLLANLLTLWRARVDWAFDLEVYSKLSSLLTTLSCARNRAGFAIESVALRRNSHTHLLQFNRYEYLGEAYARLFGLALGSQAVEGGDRLPWRIDPAPLPDLAPGYVVVNVHAGELSLERRWPIQAFALLLRILLEQYPQRSLVLVGHGAAERRYAAQLPQHPRIRDLCDRQELAESLRCVSHASLLISNDSAPLHFALAAGVPAIGLFGPTRAASYVPRDRPGVHTHSEPIYCSPCIHHWEPPPCGGDNQCMKRIPVARVLASCAAVLGEPAAASPELLRAAEETPLASESYYPGLVYDKANGGAA